MLELIKGTPIVRVARSLWVAVPVALIVANRVYEIQPSIWFDIVADSLFAFSAYLTAGLVIAALAVGPGSACVLRSSW